MGLCNRRPTVFYGKCAKKTGDKLVCSQPTDHPLPCDRLPDAITVSLNVRPEKRSRSNPWAFISTSTHTTHRILYPPREGFPGAASPSTPNPAGLLIAAHLYQKSPDDKIHLCEAHRKLLTARSSVKAIPSAAHCQGSSTNSQSSVS